MLPAYADTRFYAIYFVIFLVFGFFLLMKLLLAIFYSNYKSRYENSINKFVDKRNDYLLSKFKELDTNNKGYLNREETYKMFN